jgi:hypothetical protein
MVTRIDEGEPPESRTRPVEDWRTWFERIPELGHYAAHYGSVQIDRARLAARVACYRLFGVLFLGVVGAALLIGAVVLLVSGIAAGMRALFASQPWLGDVLAGAGIVLLLVLVIGIKQRAIDKRSFERTLRKYAERRSRQHARFGRSVGQDMELPERG